MADASLCPTIERSTFLAQLLSNREDTELRRQIESFAGETRFENLETVGIAPAAWEKIERIQIPPRLVFAHPVILQALPQTSLYYRGISLLSRKLVSKHAVSVDTWENNPKNARVTEDRALRIARLYNVCISAIILGNTDWTMDDGWRNIIATIGISADGTLRNRTGQKAEKDVRDRLVAWIREHNLVVETDNDDDAVWQLIDGVTMRFGNEPDIGFRRNGDYVVTIEVKGGRDPAGALERLGAVQKSFAETPVQCKNFLVAGVITQEMGNRLNALNIEKSFLLDPLLDDNTKWEEFMMEIFHHALRIL